MFINVCVWFFERIIHCREVEERAGTTRYIPNT